MAISEMIGGMSQLTAVFVVLTALTGALLGPTLIRICRIKTALAKGIMLGTSANGTGTSKAFEIGPVEGTIASLSMLLTAGASLVIVPLFYLGYTKKASTYTLAFSFIYRYISS